MAWSRTSRHTRGYGTAWDKLRKAILAQEPICRACKAKGRITPARELDHIVPKTNGGTDDAGNLQPLCKPCHRDKTERESAEAQGRNPKRRLAFDEDGWPVQE